MVDAKNNYNFYSDQQLLSQCMKNLHSTLNKNLQISQETTFRWQLLMRLFKTDFLSVRNKRGSMRVRHGQGNCSRNYNIACNGVNIFLRRRRYDAFPVLLHVAESRFFSVWEKFPLDRNGSVATRRKYYFYDSYRRPDIAISRKVE